MKIVKGLKKGRIGQTNGSLTTKSVHAVSENKKGYTECGVKYTVSIILGIDMPGNPEDVTCKKCLKRLLGGFAK
jgi:hypothetical protein